MGFHFMLQLTGVLVIWLSCFLPNIESTPVSNSALLIPGITNSSAELEHLKRSSGESRNESPLMVPYVCDFEKRICWLHENQGNPVTIFVPIKLLPDEKPPPEMELKALYSLVTKTKKLQMDGLALDSSSSNGIAHDQQHSSDAHPRRKRDTQYAEANDNPQQEWANQVENEAYQPFRSQRDVPGTTEPEPTSTEGHTQRSADGKQSKRSAEMDEDEVEDKDFGTPSPDEDYQDEEDAEYQPEKRFSGSEATGETPKREDSPTKTPSQPYRREVMNPNYYNYPFLANPDLYYPSPRLVSPLDGISYRSVDAMPMIYMGGYPAFWQGRATRNPQQYRPAGYGYGRGWPPVPPYYQPYANRYQPPSYPGPMQPHRGHYQHKFSKTSPYNAYKPFSYGYAQGNKNYPTPARKPIETDANMYYGK